MLGNSEKFCGTGAQNIYVCGADKWEWRVEKGRREVDCISLSTS